MKKLQAKRLPLLTLTVMLASVMGLLLINATRRVHAAATIHVTTTADSGAGSLRQAIATAAAGDTIDFQLSYPATITLTSSNLSIDKNLTINGPGADKLAVSGNNHFLVLHIKSGSTATISGLRIADGFNPSAATIPVAGIFIDHSTLNLNDCTVENNRSALGGGIGSTYSTVTLTNCTIANNFASGQGGGIQNGAYDSGDSNATMTLTNCTLSGNESGTGGGILNAGMLTITNSTITANRAGDYGGGIDNGRKLTMINCTVTGNRAATVISGASGGGIAAFDSTTLSNTIVAGNFLGTGTTPNDLKPAIYTASHCLIGDAATSGGITDGTNGNIVGVNGAGTRPIETIINPVLAENGGPTKTHMIVCGSVAYNTGDNTLAAALPKDQRGSTRVIDGTVDIGALEVHPVNNTNDSGPGSLRQMITDAAPGDCLDIDSCLTGTITLTSGIFVIRQDLTINGPGADKLTISGNNASGISHILGGRNVAINRLTLANANANGGCLNNDRSNLTLNDCTISHNTGQPGGILNTEGSLTLNNCTVSHNMSTNAGGGILNAFIPGFGPGQVTINSCTISDNHATNNGGGIYSDIGSVTINNSTIANNSAGQAGGGLYNKSVMTFSNCTVSNNSASTLGGGIYNGANANLIVTNSTITGNRNTTPGLGGGIEMDGTETLNNSIIAGNFQGSGTDPNDLNGTADNASHNLIGDAATSGGISNGANGNIVGVNVNTVLNTTLADNGGPTKTHALICGSPAIDAGDNTLAALLATDQRGLSRIYDGNGDATATVDIGAFEIQNACPTISAQAVSLAKNSSLAAVQIATVKDAEDAEQSLAVRINGSILATSNGVSVLITQPDSSGKVKANISAPCAASTASFTLSVTDSAQQSTTATFTVTVTPSNPPSFTSCPGNVTKSNDAGQCTASVSFAPTASDDCNGSIAPVCKVGETVITSPYAFPKGTTTVTCTATDGDNQTATCSFTVTVNDTQAPTINCANVAAQSASTDSNCSAMVPDVTALVRAQSSDNCTVQADLVITQSPTAGTSVSGTGSHPITVTVKDADNHSTTCVVGFTLNDTTPPTLNCPTNIVKATDPNQCAAVVSFTPSASDNCSGVGTPVCTPPSGTSFPKGTTSVTCTVKDAANNQSAPCSFTVTVVDMQPPSIVPSQNISVPATARLCSAVVSYNAPMVSDNCPGVGAPTCTPPSGTSFPKGTTVVNCSVRDAANNQGNASFTVTVVDTQPPTIACPPNAVAATINPGDASVAVSFETPSTVDNCGSVNVVCVPPSGTQFPRGVTTVNCTATDASNNQANCSFTVRVFDYVIVDDTNGKIVRFDSVTGDYDFFDCRKNKSLSGRGTVSILACKTTLTHSAADRNVVATGNPCTRVGSATVVYQGVTHTLSDANLSNNIVKCP